MPSRVVVYRTRWCGYCVLAAGLLRRKGIAFDDVDVSNDPEARAALRAQTGRGTVPVVFVDQRPIGGWVELHAMERSGELARLLARAPPG